MTDVTLTIDGTRMTVEAGISVLDACIEAGKPQPTLCFLATLTPANACRLCVVEVAGERVLAPSCSRQVRDGMEISTTSARVLHARRMILEFLGSSVDISQSPELLSLIDEYGADPGRFEAAARVEAEPLIDNPLYVRAMDRCVLCYRCVSACGEDAQWTFALSATGRGFDAHIATEFEGTLPDSACVYCGNCVGVCPTNALQFRSEYELRDAGLWDETKQSVTPTICAYCGVGCTLELHVQDNRIVKVTSPLDHDVASGHLCVKGRFGYDFVHVDVGTPIDEALRRARP